MTIDISSARRPRIGIAGVWHETNVFGPHLATIARFEEYELLVGEDIIDRHRGVKTVIGGFLDGAAWAGFDVVPTLSAGAWPGGPAPAEVIRELLQELKERVEQAHAEAPLDAVLVNLHGAMTAELSPDVEAETLRVIREIVGADVPIGAVLDLHANPTAEFVEQCDVVLCYDTYPHVDMWERGVEVATLIGQAVRGRRLKTTIRRTPLLTLPSAQGTRDEPMAGIRSRAIAAASNAGRISIAAGFAYTLPERVGLSVMIIHDVDRQSDAIEVADAVIRDIEEHAEGFAVTRPTVAEAVKSALSDSAVTPVILADLADNIGGGSAGDGTALLVELLEQEARGVLVIIADPETAAAAHEAGAGTVIECHLGGKFDQLHGGSIETSALVVKTTSGEYKASGSYMTGQTFQMGPTAVLELADGAATVLVTTRPTPPFHIEQFTHAGVEPSQAQVIVAKGAIAWRSAYESIAGSVIEVSTPGSCALDIEGLKTAVGIA